MANPCPSCGHENPDAARFCGECGSAIGAPAKCPECGAETSPHQKFCTDCGHRLIGEPAAAPSEEAEPAPVEPPTHLADKISQSAAALQGERKQVTVLFADVKGSMDLSESVDAETWRSVMDRFLGLISDSVHRFEGTVNKFTGDGAMALFGAPIAHEDHARRACYAALHLADELTGYANELRRDKGLNFSVRLGLNSGDVVVGSVGDDLHMDYTAIGHTVGLAARMEALAEPGRAYLTEHTAALVEGYFELEELGRFDVKGAHDPVLVYALCGTGTAQTRIQAAQARGLSRFVGRDEEVATLETALAGAERGGQVVGVVAEPGLGKSRLCYEFVERCRARGLQVTEGRGVAHGKRVPLLPVLEMLRSYFGIVEQDDARAAREKIAGRLLLLDEEFKEALPIMFDFLGIPDPERPPATTNAEARQRQLFAAIRRLVHVGSEQQPAVILVEDLHWLDPGSEAFLANLVESLPGGRTLLVVNFRPEYHAAWTQKSYYRQLPLLPLGEEAVGELVADLLGADPSLDGLAELVAERTGGNPFFVEEVVQGLIENGSLEGSKGAYRLVRSIEEIAIPPTVQAVLSARIDRLPDREKSVLQAAAVIGKDFSEPVLRLVAGLPDEELAASLTALRDAEFIYERSLYPEAEYSFKHPLTEEVAYRTQLGERRARMHGAVARAIAEVHEDRLDEMAAVLANHHEQAGDALEAARLSARAAWWAGQHHLADAMRHWKRVRTLLADSLDSDEAAGLALVAGMWILQWGWRLGVAEDEIAETFAESQRLAERTGDPRLRAGVQGAYAASIGMTGNVRGAFERVQAAERLAEESGDPGLRAVISPGYWLTLLGDLEGALESLDEAIERTAADPSAGRDVIGFSPYVWAVVFRAGVVLPELGRPDEGEAELDKGLRLAREHDDVETLGWAHSSYANIAAVRGEAGDSLAHAREGVAIAERLGSSFSRVLAYGELAYAHLVREEWDQAAAAAEEKLATIDASRTGVQYRSMGLATLAEAELERGNLVEAETAAREATRLASESGMTTHEARAQLALARALMRAGGALAAPEARAALERAAEVCNAWGRPHIRMGFAELARLERDEIRAGEELRAAHAMFAEMGATGWLPKVEAELAELTGTTP